jgi:hypothetical protein
MDILMPMYTMAHRLLRLSKISAPGAQSAMATLTFPLSHPNNALAAAADLLIPDRGVA